VFVGRVCLPWEAVATTPVTRGTGPAGALATEEPLVMIKRILLALTLAASLGGAVVACNTPASTTAPSVAVPSTPATVPSASDAAPSASDAAPSPSAS
jgi:hypothetical protein